MPVGILQYLKRIIFKGNIIKRIIRNNQQIHIMKLTSNKMVISGPNNPGRLTVYSFNQHKDPDSKAASS